MSSLRATPSLYVGLRVAFNAPFTNTGASTFSINGSAAAPIILSDQQALVGAEIIQSQRAELVYDGTNWQIQNPGNLDARRSVFNVLTFAAKRDGTDDVAAFQSAFDAATGQPGGGIVYAPCGDYGLASKVTWRPNVSLVGGGYGTVFKMLASGAEFGTIDVLPTKTALTVNANAGDISVTLPTGQGANFSAYQIIAFESTAVVADVAGLAREAHVIIDVTGDVVTLSDPLVFSYLTTDSATFENVSTQSTDNIEARNFTISFDAPATAPSVALDFRRTHHLRLSDIKYKAPTGGLVNIVEGIDFHVRNLTFEPDVRDDTPWAYGMNIAGACAYGVVDGIVGHDQRHLITTNAEDRSGTLYMGPRSVVIANGVGTQSDFRPNQGVIWDTHPYCHDITFVNCKGLKSIGGPPVFQIRGQRCSLVNCYASGGTRSVDIRNTVVEAEILGGTFEYATEAGIRVDGVANTKIKISGAKIQNCGQLGTANPGRGIAIASSNPYVDIENVTLDNNAEQQINLQPAGDGKVKISGCTLIRGSGAVGAVSNAPAKTIVSNTEFRGWTLADAFLAADAAAISIGNSIDGVPVDQGAFALLTANQTMDGGFWNGAMITDEGSTGGSPRLTLKAAKKGVYFGVMRVSGFQCLVTPATGENFRGQAANISLRFDSTDTFALIRCNVDGVWDAQIFKGNDFANIATDYSWV